MQEGKIELSATFRRGSKEKKVMTYTREGMKINLVYLSSDVLPFTAYVIRVNRKEAAIYSNCNDARRRFRGLVFDDVFQLPLLDLTCKY